MSRRIICFPFVLTLLASFALSAFSALRSPAQTLLVGEYYNHQAVEYDLNGNPKGIFASDSTVSRFDGMAFDKGGYLYVATQNGSVSIFAPDGTKLGIRAYRKSFLLFYS